MSEYVDVELFESGLSTALKLSGRRCPVPGSSTPTMHNSILGLTTLETPVVEEACASVLRGSWRPGHDGKRLSWIAAMQLYH